MNKPRRNTPETALRMQTALMASAHTYDDLVAISGLAKSAVQHWVKKLRALGFIYIDGWEKDVRGRLFVPRFRWGSSPDVPRAGGKSSAERMREYRARKKQAASSAGVSLEDFL